MSDAVPSALRRLVIERAGGRCEYCLIHQDHTLLPHHADHIISRKHGGRTVATNLALACADCNWAKGSDIAAADPETGHLAFFFNPRKQVWDEHFRIHEAHILPLTPEGRGTVRILQLNRPERVAERMALQRLELYP